MNCIHCEGEADVIDFEHDDSDVSLKVVCFDKECSQEHGVMYYQYRRV